MVYGEEETGNLAINYVGMIPVLTAAINELNNLKGNENTVILDLRKKYDDQSNEIEELKFEIEELKRLLQECCQRITTKEIEDETASTLYFNLLGDNENGEKMVVYQNAPNPFNENTTIRCYIPQNIRNAQLCVYNMQGAQVQCLDVAERRTVYVIIEAGKLSSGIYTYLLIGDGKTSDAKQMILTK